MPDYRRFIAYFYEYIDGKRQKNAGFVKAEQRNGVWRLNLQVKGRRWPEDSLRIFGYGLGEAVYPVILLGKGYPRKDCMTQNLQFRAESVRLEGRGFEELAGMWIPCGEGRCFLSHWKEGEADVNCLILPEHRPEKAEAHMRGMLEAAEAGMEEERKRKEREETEAAEKAQQETGQENTEQTERVRKEPEAAEKTQQETGQEKTEQTERARKEPEAAEKKLQEAVQEEAEGVGDEYQGIKQKDGESEGEEQQKVKWKNTESNGETLRKAERKDAEIGGKEQQEAEREDTERTSEAVWESQLRVVSGQDVETDMAGESESVFAEDKMEQSENGMSERHEPDLAGGTGAELQEVPEYRLEPGSREVPEYSRETENKIESYLQPKAERKLESDKISETEKTTGWIAEIGQRVEQELREKRTENVILKDTAEQGVYNKDMQRNEQSEMQRNLQKNTQTNTQRDLQTNAQRNLQRNIRTHTQGRRIVSPEERMEEVWKTLRTRCQPVAPFGEGIRQEWIRICPREVMWLKQQHWPVGRNSFLMQGFLQYRHLLLGREGMGRYVLAVPGKSDNQTAYTARVFGFTEYRQTPSSNTNQSMGYWCRRIEADAGVFDGKRDF